MTKNNEKEFIVKMQSSLITTHPKQQVLIYNEDESVKVELPISKDLQHFMNGSVKCFAFATLDKSGVIHIDRSAPWQEW